MLGLALLLAAAAVPPPVILVTVDGVRREEVFRGLDGTLAGVPGADGAPLLPRLRALAAREGFLAGDGEAGDPFLAVGDAALSLPGYQGILTGVDTGCRDNGCGRVPVETVLERAARELGLRSGEVAVVGGWPEVALAAEHRPGAVAMGVGLAPPAAPGQPAEPGFAWRAATARPARWGYRGDADTWALATELLMTRRPRLLWIALGDPDEWAHLDDYPAYAAAVAELDERLAELLALLGWLGEYGEGASVLVTTDHGRGAGEAWSRHGREIEGSRLAWLLAVTPATRAAPGQRGGGRYGHASLRPTIEALLGLRPCPGCQPPIAALLPPPAVAASRATPAAGSGGP